VSKEHMASYLNLVSYSRRHTGLAHTSRCWPGPAGSADRTTSAPQTTSKTKKKWSQSPCSKRQNEEMRERVDSF